MRPRGGVISIEVTYWAQPAGGKPMMRSSLVVVVLSLFVLPFSEGCSTAPDAGVAKDAGLADTQLPACPMLANLNSTNAAAVSWGSGRMLLNCTYTGGSTEGCLSNDVTGCPGPPLMTTTDGDLVGCSDLCAADEYGLSYGGVGPLAAPPSIDLPTGCGSGRYTPAGVAFYCCPCGLLTVPF